MRHIFRQGDDILTVVTRAKTTNEKIADRGETVVQTYHFSRGQFEQARMPPDGMRNFFAQDAAVCMDCPFAVSNGSQISACYTHKMHQYSGFLSTLRSIKQDWGEIHQLSDDVADAIVEMSAGLYVRFGTYGEPSLLPIDLIARICAVAKSWTGYTHQWMRRPELSSWFMASVHSKQQVAWAAALGFRSFLVQAEHEPGLVNCPASAEAGYRSTCSRCGLCSGTEGKGKKSIYILEH